MRTVLLNRARCERNELGYVRTETRTRLAEWGVSPAALESYLITTEGNA